MKQHPIKNSSLRGVLFILLCIVGIGNVWGEETVTVSIKHSDVIGKGKSGGGEGFNYTLKPINISFSNAYGASDHIKAYGNSTITFSGVNITKIVITATSSDYLQTWKHGENKLTDSSDKSKATWKGSSNNITLKNNSTSQARITTITITYEIDANPPTLESIAICDIPSTTNYYVGDTPSAEGLTVIATYSDNTTDDVTASAKWTFDPATIKQNTTSITIRADYEGKWDEKNYNISRMSIANTEDNPYSVAEAYNYINEGKGLAEEVYVKGIISKVDSYDATSGSITYWISEDGTTTSQQFMCEGGLDIEKNKFTSINDLKLGSIVVVKGLLQKNNDIYLFGMDNELVSNDDSNALTLTAIEISGVPSKTSYNVGESPSADGFVVTAIYSNYNSQESRIIDSSDVEWSFTPQTIEEGTTTMTATATYREQKNNIEFDIDVNKCILTYKLVPLKNGNNEYATGSNITISGVTWNATGNTDYIPWRIGGKSIDEIERDIKSTTPVYGCVENVVISIGAKSGSIDFHSLTLSVADNPNYSNEIIYRKNSPQENTDYSFDITPATDAYYKITYKVSVSGNSNAFFYFKGATFHGRPASAVTPITSAGYATLCLPYNATVPQGLTAYTASDKGDYIKLTAKAGGKIAAGEGVVLKGEENTYTFVATAESVLPTEGNLMVGVTENTHLTATDNAYMLVRDKNSGEITFSLLNADYTLSANKAYLKLEENDARKQISTIWDDNGTGIDEILNTSTLNNNTIYNLSGQRLRQRQKGLNIIDGKLVIE